MKKKVFLITGGAGFIGSHISRYLKNKGHEIVIFDDFSRGRKNKISDIIKSVKLIHGDIRNFKDLKKIPRNINAIIHLAYINGTDTFYSNPVKVLDVGIKGLINIFDFAIQRKIKEAYLASSSEVYNQPKKIPTTENEMIKIPNIYNPRFSYSVGKILTEIMGVNYGKKYFKKLIIFRPHNVYGNDMGNGHVIPNLFEKIKKTQNGKITIKGTGKEIRSFIHINDFLRAFDILIRKGKHLNVYNIGNNEKTNIFNLALNISNILQKKISVQKSSIHVGGTKIRCPNISKIKKLGFVPKINLNKGLNYFNDKK